MKNILPYLIAITAIVTICVSKENPTLNVSDLVLSNIEALANGETEGERILCYKKIEGFQGAPMEDKTWCSECKARPATKWSDRSECTQ